jgi:hypothetical protein
MNKLFCLGPPFDVFLRCITWTLPKSDIETCSRRHRRYKDLSTQTAAGDLTPSNTVQDHPRQSCSRVSHAQRNTHRQSLILSEVIMIIAPHGDGITATANTPSIRRRRSQSYNHRTKSSVYNTMRLVSRRQANPQSHLPTHHDKSAMDTSIEDSRPSPTPGAAVPQNPIQVCLSRLFNNHSVVGCRVVFQSEIQYSCILHRESLQFPEFACVTL